MQDIIGYIAATLTTFSFLPQVIKIVKTKQTQDISLFMYIIFNIGVFLWLTYGILAVLWPVIIANIITSMFAMTILIYKIKEK